MNAAASVLGREGCAVEHIAGHKIAVGELLGTLTRVGEGQDERHARVDGDGVRRGVAGDHDALDATRAACDGLHESPAALDDVDTASLGPDHPDEAFAEGDPGGGRGDEVELVGGIGDVEHDAGGLGGGGLVLCSENAAGEVRGDLGGGRGGNHGGGR